MSKEQEIKEWWGKARKYYACAASIDYLISRCEELTAWQDTVSAEMKRRQKRIEELEEELEKALRK